MILRGLSFMMIWQKVQREAKVTKQYNERKINTSVILLYYDCKF